MKRMINYTIALVVLFIASNCATTNPKQNEKAITSMDEVQELTDEMLTQLNEVESSLNSITTQNQDNPNLQEAFNSYQEDVEAIVSMRSEYEELSEEMISESNEYLAQWQKEETSYRNPELRQASEQRRRDLNSDIDRINEDTGELSRRLNEYIRDAEEIESYLSKDLTQKGISAVTSLGEDVESNGQDVRSAINNLQSSISSMKTNLGRGQDPTTQEN